MQDNTCIMDSVVYINEQLSTLSVGYLEVGSTPDYHCLSTAVNCIQQLLLLHQRDTRFRDEVDEMMCRTRSDNETLHRKLAKATSSLEKWQRDYTAVQMKYQSSEHEWAKTRHSLQTELQEVKKRDQQLTYKHTQVLHKCHRMEKEVENVTEKYNKFVHDKEMSAVRNGVHPKIQILNDITPKAARTLRTHRDSSTQQHQRIGDMYEERLSHGQQEVAKLQGLLNAFNNEVAEAITRQSADCPNIHQSALLRGLPLHMSESAVTEQFKANLSLLIHTLVDETPSPPTKDRRVMDEKFLGMETLQTSELEDSMGVDVM